MLDMDLPPYDADAAVRMGDNSRAAEIQKHDVDAALARVQYLRDNVREGAPNKAKVLYAASISSMSAEAFRQLFVMLSFANRDCDNMTVGYRRVGMLLNRSERSVKRVAKELEESGWLSEPQRRGPSPSTRSALIPPKALNAIIFEVLERSNLTSKIEMPDMALRKTEVSDVSRQGEKSGPKKCHLRQDEVPNLATEPYIEPSVVVEVPARESSASLVEEDYSDYYRLFKTWGRKSGDIFGMFGGRPIIREGDSGTDRHLDRCVAALQAYEPEMRIEAARMTILSMQSRTMIDDAHRGPSGFGSYFQQELRGMAAVLRDARNNPPPQIASISASQSARGSQPQQASRTGGPPGGQNGPDWARRKDQEAENSRKNTEDMRRAREMVQKELGQ